MRLPPNQSLDPLYIKGEGGDLIVLVKNYKKFIKTTEALGFIVPEIWVTCISPIVLILLPYGKYR